MVRTIKKFFTVTKYLWIGGIMGMFQQLLGKFDYFLYQGAHDSIFNFSEIMGGLSIYAAIILLVIRRDVPPKHQFRDLLLFFVGLDFFYYLYIFIFEFIALISGHPNLTDPMVDDGFYFPQTVQEIADFMYWTSIGLASAVWAYVATKLRNMGKKKLYIIMLIPLFAVMVILLVLTTGETIMFFITGGERTPVTNPSTGGVSYSGWYSSHLAGALTSLISLIFCLYKFLKKPTVKKDHTQEA